MTSAREPAPVPAPSRGLPRTFFARPALEVARDLIGRTLIHDTPEGPCAGIIVETEAYGSGDPGSHAFRGMTPRNAPMFEAPGHAYVYFTYGMHYCFNIVTDPDGVAGAVLVRAVEPSRGIELMGARRGAVADRDLARGPARLTKAFAIGREQNRLDLTRGPLRVTGTPRAGVIIGASARIGLGAKQDGRHWRFFVDGSPWVSRGAKGAGPPDVTG